MVRKAPDARDAAVGKRVRFYRMQCGLSQEAVGNAVGLTFQQIQKYEKGTNRIAPSRLEAFARLFKVPVASFFPSMDKKGDGAGDDVTHLTQSRATLDLLQALNKIDNPKVTAALVRLVEAIRNQ